jgi:hypothetical protein
MKYTGQHPALMLSRVALSVHETSMFLEWVSVGYRFHARSHGIPIHLLGKINYSHS